MISDIPNIRVFCFELHFLGALVNGCPVYGEGRTVVASSACISRDRRFFHRHGLPVRLQNEGRILRRGKFDIDAKGGNAPIVIIPNRDRRIALCADWKIIHLIGLRLAVPAAADCLLRIIHVHKHSNIIFARQGSFNKVVFRRIRQLELQRLRVFRHGDSPHIHLGISGLRVFIFLALTPGPFHFFCPSGLFNRSASGRQHGEGRILRRKGADRQQRDRHHQRQDKRKNSFFHFFPPCDYFSLCKRLAAVVFAVIGGDAYIVPSGSWKAGRRGLPSSPAPAA